MYPATKGEWRLKFDAESVASAKKQGFKGRSTMREELQKMEASLFSSEGHQVALAYSRLYGTGSEDNGSSPEGIDSEHSRWYPQKFGTMCSWA